jgi:hypothetical protein
MDDVIENPAAVAKLEPSIRCAALAGYFLQVWAMLEPTLNRAIVDALRLSDLQGVVVTKNIQLRDLIHILKTLVHMQGIKVERHKKSLEAISTISHDRNMVAHDTFLPDDEGDGVKFLVIRARGKLTFPPTRWSVGQFFEKYLEIVRLTKEVENMKADLLRPTLTNTLWAGKWPKHAPFSPNLLSPLLHPTQEPQHSSPLPTTPETGDGKPPSPDQE